MSLRLVLTWLLTALPRGPAVHVHVHGHRGGPPQPNSTNSTAAAPGGDASGAAPNASLLRLEDETSDAGGCSECDYTIDFRCPNTLGKGPFHRIKDCLIPSYALVEAARNATGRRCAIVKVGELSVEPLLSALTTDVNFTFIRDGSPCLNRNSETFTSLSRFEVQEFTSYTPSGPDRLHVSGWVPFNLAKNVALLQHDAAAVSAGVQEGNDNVLIIVRSETRMFTEKSLDMLMYTASHSEGHPKVSLYFGNETHLDTIRLFRAASTIIGFYGAGFVNSVFRSSPQCAIEYTAWENPEGTRLWRTNNVLATFIPKLSWYYHPISFPSMLLCNSIGKRAFEESGLDRNDFLEYMEYVCINRPEIAALKKNLGLCAQDSAGSTSGLAAH